MPAKTICRRLAIWASVVLVGVLLWGIMHKLNVPWSSEAIIQALAGLGGLAYWASRSRSRVTLLLSRRNRGSTFLDIENVGSRIATQVRVACDPPIQIMVTSDGEDKIEKIFGPVEDFGDMDRGQRYSVEVDWRRDPDFIGDVLEEITFEVSHESTYGIRRRKSKMRLGGEGVRRSSSEEASTPLGRIASAVSRIDQKTRHG